MTYVDEIHLTIVCLATYHGLDTWAPRAGPWDPGHGTVCLLAV